MITDQKKSSENASPTIWIHIIGSGLIETTSTSLRINAKKIIILQTRNPVVQIVFQIQLFLVKI